MGRQPGSPVVHQAGQALTHVSRLTRPKQDEKGSVTVFLPVMEPLNSGRVTTLILRPQISQ
jgi:hypothetical protein